MEILLILAVLCAKGCAGSGAGLDENGNPIGSDGNGIPVAFDPTFSNIQNQVFTPICTECHAGPAAPQGLRLDATNSYGNLVDVPSVEVPQLLRVAPGEPGNSYLIRKLEGGPGIAGAQMPLDRTPLPQPVINSIRLWISQGALRN
jgi:hypothetical protein